MPTEEMVTSFNELRQDVVLLYELKLALASCEYDQQMLRHRHDTLNPNSRVCVCVCQCGPLKWISRTQVFYL